jgi:hypothetical protein
LFWCLCWVVFTEFSRCTVWCLEGSQSLLFQIFLLVYSLFLVFELYVCEIFVIVPKFLGVLFYSPYWFWISVWKISIDLLSRLWLLSSESVACQLMSPLKAFFISVTVILISSISFKFFLRGSKQTPLICYITHLLLHFLTIPLAFLKCFLNYFQFFV